MLRKYYILAMACILVPAQSYTMGAREKAQLTAEVRNLLNTPLADWNQQHINQIEQKINTLKKGDPTQSRIFTAELDNLRNQMGYQQRQIRGIQANQQELDQLRAQLEEAQKQAQTNKQNEQELNKLQKEINKLKQEAAQAQDQSQEIKNLKEHIAELEDDLATAQVPSPAMPDINSLKNRISDLEQSLKKAQAESADDKQEIKELKQAMLKGDLVQKDLVKQIENLKQQLADAPQDQTAEIKNLKEQIAKLKTDLDNANLQKTRAEEAFFAAKTAYENRINQIDKDVLQKYPNLQPEAARKVLETSIKRANDEADKIHKDYYGTPRPHRE
ncbi:MAG TPA: hypothetical protein PLU71_03650 [Candidatus Dependentiae bacterium]|nr:hypothetical protein [Candidatus Dependentiae bacterium]HRQ62926.1 hypothetical protein [Candidatus Dependentiae bacterium]